MPRGKTFPVRRAVVSRFEGGKILEGDYAQLEYRVAGFLSKDKHVYENVKGGIDVHNLTATIITGKDKEDITSEERQNAKAHTFAPLYGATGIGLPEHVHRYYYQFTEVYPGIGEWHDRLAQEALKYKVVSLPSGREYRFPYVKRTARGITHGTSVKNYPVQGFATADLLPSALVLTFEEFKKKKLKSLLCNTVHDSIVVDVHPDEEDQVIEIVKECMLSIPQQAKRRWGIEYDMPVGIEIKIGSNWLDTKEIFSN
jgi:DNA polymerase I-like protein with 3'-5' exonuclease and polymerase domains